MEDIDLYGDLEEFDISEKLKEAKKEIANLTERLRNSTQETSRLEALNIQLSNESKVLTRNTSSLMLTAKCEIQRKEKEIQTLRREKEDICFRRSKVENKKLISVAPDVPKVDLGMQTELTFSKDDVINVQRTGQSQITFSLFGDEDSCSQLDRGNAFKRRPSVCVDRLRNEHISLGPDFRSSRNMYKDKTSNIPSSNHRSNRERHRSRKHQHRSRSRDHGKRSSHYDYDRADTKRCRRENYGRKEDEIDSDRKMKSDEAIKNLNILNDHPSKRSPSKLSNSVEISNKTNVKKNNANRIDRSENITKTRSDSFSTESEIEVDLHKLSSLFKDTESIFFSKPTEEINYETLSSAKPITSRRQTYDPNTLKYQSIEGNEASSKSKNLKENKINPTAKSISSRRQTCNSTNSKSKVIVDDLNSRSSSSKRKAEPRSDLLTPKNSVYDNKLETHKSSRDKTTNESRKEANSKCTSKKSCLSPHTIHKAKYKTPLSKLMDELDDEDYDNMKDKKQKNKTQFDTSIGDAEAAPDKDFSKTEKQKTSTLLVSIPLLRTNCEPHRNTKHDLTVEQKLQSLFGADDSDHSSTKLRKNVPTSSDTSTPALCSSRRINIFETPIASLVEQIFAAEDAGEHEKSDDLTSCDASPNTSSLSVGETVEKIDLFLTRRKRKRISNNDKCELLAVDTGSSTDVSIPKNNNNANIIRDTRTDSSTDDPSDNMDVDIELTQKCFHDLNAQSASIISLFDALETPRKSSATFELINDSGSLVDKIEQNRNTLYPIPSIQFEANPPVANSKSQISCEPNSIILKTTEDNVRTVQHTLVDDKSADNVVDSTTVVNKTVVNQPKIHSIDIADINTDPMNISQDGLNRMQQPFNPFPTNVENNISTTIQPNHNIVNSNAVEQIAGQSFSLVNDSVAVDSFVPLTHSSKLTTLNCDDTTKTNYDTAVNSVTDKNSEDYLNPKKDFIKLSSICVPADNSKEPSIISFNSTEQQNQATNEFADNSSNIGVAMDTSNQVDSNIVKVPITNPSEASVSVDIKTHFVRDLEKEHDKTNFPTLEVNRDSNHQEDHTKNISNTSLETNNRCSSKKIESDHLKTLASVTNDICLQEIENSYPNTINKHFALNLPPYSHNPNDDDSAQPPNKDTSHEELNVSTTSSTKDGSFNKSNGVLKSTNRFSYYVEENDNEVTMFISSRKKKKKPKTKCI